jgi:hypothetical protein
VLYDMSANGVRINGCSPYPQNSQEIVLNRFILILIHLRT